METRREIKSGDLMDPARTNSSWDGWIAVEHSEYSLPKFLGTGACPGGGNEEKWYNKILRETYSSGDPVVLPTTEKLPDDSDIAPIDFHSRVGIRMANVRANVAVIGGLRGRLQARVNAILQNSFQTAVQLLVGTKVAAMSMGIVACAAVLLAVYQPGAINLGGHSRADAVAKNAGAHGPLCRGASCGLPSSFVPDAMRGLIRNAAWPIGSAPGGELALGWRGLDRRDETTSTMPSPTSIVTGTSTQARSGSSNSSGETINFAGLGVVVLRDLPDGTTIPSGVKIAATDWAVPAGEPGPIELRLPDGDAPAYRLGIDLFDANGLSTGTLRLLFHHGLREAQVKPFAALATESFGVSENFKAALAASNAEASKRAQQSISQQRRVSRAYRARAKAKARDNALPKGAAVEVVKVVAAPASKVAAAAGKVSSQIVLQQPAASPSKASSSPALPLTAAQNPPAAGPVASFFNALAPATVPSGLGGPPPPPSQPWAPASITDAVTRPF